MCVRPLQWDSFLFVAYAASRGTLEGCGTERGYCLKQACNGPPWHKTLLILVCIVRARERERERDAARHNTRSWVLFCVALPFARKCSARFNALVSLSRKRRWDGNGGKGKEDTRKQENIEKKRTHTLSALILYIFNFPPPSS